MILYGELTKIEPQDDGTLKVHGVASTGGRDSAGEVVSPAAMRAALPGYMAYPALREMHQPLAAGAALYAEVDEEGATRICAHVVDPTAVKKVRAGVYKGLSIGGKVLARDPADASLITSIRLDEISLVDRPCNPEAVIDLWKAAPPQAPTNEAVRAEADAMAKAAGRPGRRNDYVAAARAKLMESAPLPLDGGGAGVGVKAPPVEEEATAPPSPESAVSLPSPPFPHQGGRETLAKLAAAESDLAAARAEIERLKAAPLPPRAAASRLAKAVGKTEDGEPRSRPTPSPRRWRRCPPTSAPT